MWILFLPGHIVSIIHYTDDKWCAVSVPVHDSQNDTYFKTRHKRVFTVSWHGRVGPFSAWYFGQMGLPLHLRGSFMLLRPTFALQVMAKKTWGHLWAFLGCKLLSSFINKMLLHWRQDINTCFNIGTKGGCKLASQILMVSFFQPWGQYIAPINSAFISNLGKIEKFFFSISALDS
jgi:hypothetical protein